jgi:predicted MFS family arabinose efflux permease
MGTFASAIDLGIGGGAFLWGFVAQKAGYPAMFLGAAAVAVVAIVVFVAGWRTGGPAL